MPNEETKIRNLKAVPKRISPPVESDPDECPKCYGIGMEIVVGKGARICSCRKIKAGVHDPLTRAGVPHKFRNCDFKSYLLTDRFKERAVRKCFEFATKFPDVKQGLLLKGPVGVGKTHLAVAIVKAVLQESKNSVLFCDFNELLSEIRNSFDPRSETSELGILSPVITADLLVLDEFAAKKLTDWVRDTMMGIISARYNSGKTTILTTNYLDHEELLEEFETQRSLKQKELGDANSSVRQEWERDTSLAFQRLLAADQTLDERIGYRLRSRLYEMCEEIYIGGGDFRKQNRKRTMTNTP